MFSIEFAVVVAAAMFASGVAGLFLQRLLPEHHTADRSRDMIGGVVGLLTLLLALVLGLLIWTAYGVFTTQQTELNTLSARALEYNLELKQYGPEAKHGRELLRTDLVWAHEQFWGEGDAQAQAYDASYADMSSVSSFLGSLQPATDAQRQLLGAAGAHYGSIGETSAADVAATEQSDFLAAPHHGDRVVVPLVPRIRHAVAHQRRDLGRAGARHDLRGERDLHDPRIQPALYQPDPHLAGRARAGDHRPR